MEVNSGTNANGRDGEARGRLLDARRRRAHGPDRPRPGRPRRRGGPERRDRLRRPGCCARAARSRCTISEFVFITADFAFQQSDEPLTSRPRHDAAIGRRDRDDDRRVQRLRVLRHRRPVLGHERRRQGRRRRRDARSGHDRRGRPGDRRRDVRAGAAQAGRRPTRPAANELRVYTSFTALKLKGDVALVGVEDVTANIKNLTLELNSATLVTPGLNPPPAIDFTLLDGGGLEVPVSDSDTLLIDFDGRRLRAGAYVELGFGGFVHISGSLVFEMGEVIDDQLLTNGTTKTLSVMKIGASNVNIFVGEGGPYWVDSNENGEIDGGDIPAEDGAVGIALGGVEVAVALLKTIPPGDAGVELLRDQRTRGFDQARRRRGRDGARHRHRGRRQRRRRPAGGHATRPWSSTSRRRRRRVAAGHGRPRDGRDPRHRVRRLGARGAAARSRSSSTASRSSRRSRSPRPCGPNGQKVTKISLTDTSFSVGIGDPAFTISGAERLHPAHAARAWRPRSTSPATTISVGHDFSFSTGFSVKINNTNRGRRTRSSCARRRPVRARAAARPVPADRGDGRRPDAAAASRSTRTRSRSNASSRCPARRRSSSRASSPAGSAQRRSRPRTSRAPRPASR